MRTIIIIIIAVLMASCTDMSIPEPDINDNPLGSDIIVVDSCEYVTWSSGYGGGICHKGNCKFCKQRKENNNE